MIKIILFHIFMIISFLIYSQEKNLLEDISQNDISFNSYISFESNNLKSDFLNTIVYGGFITNEMKESWINSGGIDNKLNAEIINGIRYSFRNRGNNLIYISMTDINYINANFSDDLLKLALYGNFYYQSDTLDFSKTVIRINRYQQYKVGYNFNLFKNNINWNINTAISYLNGNHHAQYNIDKGFLYTEDLGTSLEMNYDITTMMTDTSNMSPFIGNGNGIAIDIGLNMKKENSTFGIQLRDLGMIKWKSNSIINNTDSSFNFSGIEIDEFNSLPAFNDSILELSFNKRTNSFKSFIPAKITITYNKLLKHNLFKNILIANHTRWHPYYTSGVINYELFERGFEESRYDSRWDLITNMEMKLLYTSIGLSSGGYSEKTSIYLNIMDKRRIVSIGTRNLEGFFNKDRSSLTIHFSLTKHF